MIDNHPPIPCQRCGRYKPLWKVDFHRRMVFILGWHKQTKGYLCKRCIHQVSWNYTLLTLAFGWWAFFSLMVTLMILITNPPEYWRTLREPPDVWNG